MRDFRPMLAATLESVNQIKFPCYAQPKIDGHRAYKKDGETYTGRHGKDIENTFIRETLRAMAIDNVDGELIVPGVPFSKCSGELRRHDSKPNFEWHIFDQLIDMPFFSRDPFLVSSRINSCPIARHRVKWIPTTLIFNVEQFNVLEENYVTQGYEGIILRSTHGEYKQGRSTLKEFYLVKYKRWLDDEAVIVDFEEQYENQNVATTNAFGQTERSSHQGNLKGKNTLGAFVCNWRGQILRIGTGEGLTDVLRKSIWLNRPDYVGQKVTFKYLPIGMKDLPRQPIFKCFRYD
jgi:DNA ligase-1